MIRLRRHGVFVLLAALLIGGLPVLHSAQHVAEHAQTEALAPHAAPSDAAPGASASGRDTDTAHVAALEQAECDLCARTLHGAPAATQPPAVLQASISEKTRLRSRALQRALYHFVIRGPPAHA